MTDRRRFVIAADGRVMDAHYRDRVTLYLQAKQWELWHWFDDLWLVANAPASVTAAQLRDDLIEVTDGVALFLVFEVAAQDHKTSAGVIPEPSHRWMVERWHAFDRVAYDEGSGTRVGGKPT